MARARVELNAPGVEAVLSAPGVQAFLTEQAERVAAAARASAPVATGAYRDSIAVESGPSPVDGRARAIVKATAPHANLVESRTGNLARALIAAGG